MPGWFKKKNIPVLSAKEGYDCWASTYACEANPIKDFSNNLVEKMLPDLSGKSVLDAGCGTGHFCMYAEKQHADKVLGLDLSESMINQARKNCRSTQLECVDLSAKALDPDAFDVIICALVIGHIENISGIIKNLATSLRKNGRMILTDFHPVLTMNLAKRTFKDPQTGDTIEIRHYLHTLDEIKKLLHENGLVVEGMEEPTWNGNPVVYGLRVLKN